MCVGIWNCVCWDIFRYVCMCRLCIYLYMVEDIVYIIQVISCFVVFVYLWPGLSLAFSD